MKTRKTFHIRKYICDLCEETFQAENSIEDQTSERDALFPDLPQEEQAQVCHDCFVKLMDYNEPGMNRYEEYINNKE